MRDVIRYRQNATQPVAKLSSVDIMPRSLDQMSRGGGPRVNWVIGNEVEDGSEDVPEATCDVVWEEIEEESE